MADQRWLHLQLAGPLLAFGGVRIDQLGPTREFPAASMLTGLLANALGWQRWHWQAHQDLQDRLVFAARREHEAQPGLLIDMQNAALEKTDRGWTTWGEVEGRDGASYGGPHRRERHYQMDASLRVVLRLAPAEGALDLDALAAALDRPQRPLFIGRKPCLPVGRIVQGWVTAADAHQALSAVAPVPGPLRALWPVGEGPETGPTVDRIIDLADLRNWRTGLHGGARPVVEGWLHPAGAAP